MWLGKLQNSIRRKSLLYQTVTIAGYEFDKVEVLKVEEQVGELRHGIVGEERKAIDAEIIDSGKGIDYGLLLGGEHGEELHLPKLGGFSRMGLPLKEGEYVGG